MPNPGGQWWPTMTGDPPTSGLFEAIRPRPMSASEFYAPVKALRPTFEAYGGDALWNPDTKRWGEGTVGCATSTHWTSGLLRLMSPLRR